MKVQGNPSTTDRPVTRESVGAEAKAAIPALLPLLKDADSSVCMEAGAAILLIDPAAAARVGIFEDPHIIR